MTPEERARAVDARKATKLGEATAAELADELGERDEATNDWLIDQFEIEPDEQPSQFYEHRDEIGDIYDAVAEGRTADALAAIHALVCQDVALLAPTSQLNLRAKRT